MSVIKCCLNCLRNIKWIFKYSLYDEFRDAKYIIKDETIEDIVYQYEDEVQHLKKLNILNEEQTIDLLYKEPKSFCRLGDGEIRLICGEDQAFQKYDEDLAERLLNILEDYNPKMYVGINWKYFHGFSQLSEENRKFNRLEGTKYRRFLCKHCNDDNVYIDASFTMAHFQFVDSYDFETHYKKLKGLFKDRKILLVCGEGVLDNIGNNVFEEACSLRTIPAPKINAFSEYDSIIDKILNTVEKDEIICFILGMAGKVMICDLTEKGYIAWDIGHMAKDYDAYMKNVERNTKNTRLFYSPD